MQEKFKKYAILLLKKGLGIKKGQPLLVNAPVEAYEFIRVLTDVACSLGVVDIYYDWYDDEMKHSQLKNYSEEEICNSRFWNKTIHDEYAKKDAAFLFLISNGNVDMSDISGDKLMIAGKQSLNTRKKYREMQENNLVSWCIAAVSTEKWANLIFDNRENDIDKLWEKIFEICLVDTDDPVEEWNKKMINNHKLCKKLNELKIKKLHYKNSLGTDLTIELSDKACWCGGSSIVNDQEIIVNLPTEEVFTTPDKNKTEGIVYTSMPLIHQGVIIKDICLEFKEGKVVKYYASEGYDELKNILTMDEESMMLGEAALVDKNSPICKSGILFYETLYDENAACHIALGKGFKECLNKGNDMSNLELEECGYNKSKNHVDIMIGTDDLMISAITYDEKEIEIFKNGTFVI